jgi:hypothetical protein
LALVRGSGAGNPNNSGASGNDSVFNTITSTGGGGGLEQMKLAATGGSGGGQGRRHWQVGQFFQVALEILQAHLHHKETMVAMDFLTMLHGWWWRWWRNCGWK